METNRLRQFCTVFETKNLRQSAEIIGMTHGALSKSIKVLEEDLGFKLFIPEGRGFVPTEEAKSVYLQAQTILAEVAKLKIPKKEVPRNVIKIASFEVFTTYFLQTFGGELKELDIEIHELTQGKLEAAVRDKIVDIGITYEPIPTENVEFLQVNSIIMSPYVRKGSFKNTPITEIPFAAPLQPLIGAPTGVRGLDGWPEHQHPRKIQFKVEMMESAMEICRQGACAVFVADFIANFHNQVVKPKYQLEKREYPGKMKKIKRGVFLVKRKNSTETPQMKKVAKFLRKL